MKRYFICQVNCLYKNIIIIILNILIYIKIYIGDRRHLSWYSRWLTLKLGKKCSIDFQNVIRITKGQTTYPFERLSKDFGYGSDKSLSIIYVDRSSSMFGSSSSVGKESSLDLMLPNEEIFQYFYNALTLVLQIQRQ